MTQEEEIRALKEQLREALERLEKMDGVVAENQALQEQLIALFGPVKSRRDHAEY